ncbi:MULTISPECIES: M15 family metallopeptidase [unclassified Treponema]|uniref:M15 family metallopeptidase n=1 Tax=unclassified Treponema TaxID=2638727 RepID=UPI0020A281A2|nr:MULTISPECIES: M15 family metallopeptidase [unclassified Treponema]UTC66381.1 M15 family metallopeptidase [Treponema sp. OMZ 789]UTC69111.1 M15 family metallopeptidase [Treponema sp. OMZ 790]UTC71823.1 M15 family metallopeptidase [Treponema sp. OMZ 791]
MQIILKNEKKLLIVLFFFCFINLNITIGQNKDKLDDFNFNLDNPWLSLRAIQMSYPDLVKNISFDSEVNDWFITIRNQNLYWAHGRLLPKKDIEKWRNWSPVISYFYSDEVQNPKEFSKDLIASLRPESLIKHRKKSPPPNYIFAKLIFNGKNRKEIIKQLRRLKFLGYDVWVHHRVVEPLKRVQKKIYAAQKKDLEVKKFLKELNQCWSFNWRVIADSGKLSNHSWGSAIDLLPKDYRNKKMYWFWEAVRDDHWMKIMPYRRWFPPKAVIEAFESEGFIWGGKWTLWDNMHFEYRPELLYIRNFVLHSEFNEFIAKDSKNTYSQSEPTIEQTGKKLPKNLEDIFRIADLVKFALSFSEKLDPFYGFKDENDPDNGEIIEDETNIEEPKYLEEMIE